MAFECEAAEILIGPVDRDVFRSRDGAYLLHHLRSDSNGAKVLDISGTLFARAKAPGLSMVPGGLRSDWSWEGVLYRLLQSTDVARGRGSFHGSTPEEIDQNWKAVTCKLTAEEVVEVERLFSQG